MSTDDEREPPEADEDRVTETALDEALDALAEGDVEACLGHLEDVDPARGERWTTATHALLELGEGTAAASALEHARTLLAPDDENLLWAEGRLALVQWRIAEARAAFARLDPEVEGAPLLDNLALLADLEGAHERADALYRRAARMEPEDSPVPPRLTPAQFEEVVAQASAQLPAEFQAALEEIPVVIDPMPSAALVGAPGSGHPPDLLGLFTGAPIAERGLVTGELPATIFLFQRNLERVSRNRDELLDEIRTTLYHELGHALGFDEEGVDELGLG